METVRLIVEAILAKMGVSGTIEMTTFSEQSVVSVAIPDSDLLVGAQGDTLRALNTIVRLLAEKQGVVERFSVDVNGHNRVEIEKLQITAKSLAERARTNKSDVELNPMRPFDRMIVHAALSGEHNIKTESIGEGRERRIVIKYIEIVVL